MNSNIAKIREEGEYVIELVKTQNSKNQAFYSYLLLQKSNLENFKKTLKSGNTFNLDDWGVILASGEGHNPSPDVWNTVQEKLKKS